MTTPLDRIRALAETRKPATPTPTSLERLQALAERYDIELVATTAEDAKEELYRRVPELASARRFARRNFVPKGDPRGIDLDPGDESRWDVR